MSTETQRSRAGDYRDSIGTVRCGWCDEPITPHSGPTTACPGHRSSFILGSGRITVADWPMGLHVAGGDGHYWATYDRHMVIDARGRIRSWRSRTAATKALRRELHATAPATTRTGSVK